MSIQEILSSRIDLIEQIIRKHNLPDTLILQAAELRRTIEQFSFRILLVGSFNAGKSTFLNKLIEKDDLLVVSGIPETDIATELVYDESEYIEAFNGNGETKRFSFSERKKINTEEWWYLVYHINSSFLFRHPHLTLVDMPGLNSTNDRHNKAIAQYIARSSAYLLFIDAQDGTIHKTTYDFMREIAQYKQSVACFVSRSDMLPPSKLSESINHIHKTVSGLLGEDIPTIPVSGYYDIDLEYKADQAIGYFDPDILLENQIAPLMNQLIHSVTYSLKTIHDNMTLDDREIKQKINSLQKAKIQLEAQFQAETQKYQRRYTQEIIPQIMFDIESTLKRNLDTLANSLEYGPESFSAKINTILRPVIFKATQTHIDASFREFADQFDLSFLSDDSAQQVESIESILRGILSFTSAINNRQQNNSDQNSQTEESNSKDTSALYQTLTTLAAITTDFLPPIVELVIVFLPTIVSLFSGLNRSAKREDLRHQLSVSIIPQICEKIRPEISKAAEQMKNTLLSKLKQQFQQALDLQTDALNDALAQKENISHEYHKKRTTLEEDVERLKNV